MLKILYASRKHLLSDYKTGNTAPMRAQSFLPSRSLGLRYKKSIGIYILDPYISYSSPWRWHIGLRRCSCGELFSGKLAMKFTNLDLVFISALANNVY